VSYDQASAIGRSNPEDDLYPGRRQLDTLSPAEIRENGVWWFPGPDGHLSGPDLQTVLPLDTSEALPDGSVAFPEGKYLLRTSFRLADGSACEGHITYSADDGGTLREREPTLCTDQGQIPLWHGQLVPDDEDKAAWLSRLDRDRDAVFPLTWRAAYHPPGDELRGELAGFAVVRDGTIETV